MKIRLLPDSVANQIAAGEVVGNASSVVKEMAENAVDAGASLVTINFRADGRELVQVTDNGEGMTPADARLAFDKHATSKMPVTLQTTSKLSCVLHSRPICLPYPNLRMENPALS